MITKLSDQNSIANQYVAELRDMNIQKDRMRFRLNLERLGSIFAYEISKTLNYRESEIETPLGLAKAQVPTDKIVLATILRAGLPFHQGMLQIFDNAENAFISAYRQHHKDGSFEIRMQYITCPDLTDCTLIIADPMIATGSSVDKSIQALLENGKPKNIHLATVIASSDGLNFIKRVYPDIHLWLVDEDDELTARSYIVPGLGDAGDLAFGAKKQD